MPLIASKKKINTLSQSKSSLNHPETSRTLLNNDDLQTPMKSKKANISICTYERQKTIQKPISVELAQIKTKIDIRNNKINNVIYSIVRKLQTRKLVNQNKIAILFSLKECKQILQCAKSAQQNLSQVNQQFLQRRRQLLNVTNQCEQLQQKIQQYTNKIQQKEQIKQQKKQNIKNKEHIQQTLQSQKCELLKQKTEIGITDVKKCKFYRDLFQLLVLQEQIRVRKEGSKNKNMLKKQIQICLKQISDCQLKNIDVEIKVCSRIFIKYHINQINPVLLNQLSFFCEETEKILKYKHFLQLLQIEQIDKFGGKPINKYDSMSANTQNRHEIAINFCRCEHCLKIDKNEILTLIRSRFMRIGVQIKQNQ